MRLRSALLAFLFASPAAWASHTGPADCRPPEQSAAALAPAPRIEGLRVGLALGSGSQHGIAHVGVIREIEARGLDVRVVAGTSVGALVGALWASGMPAREVERLVLANADRDFGRLSLSDGLYSNAGLADALDAALGGRRIEAWPRRFGAVATNLANGQRRILSAGDPLLAIRASTATPVVFSSVNLAGERLVDGALVEPVPVGAARALGADVVIAIDVAYRPWEEPVSGITGAAFQSMHILVNSLATEQLRSADVALRLDLHEVMACGNAALVDAGARALRAAWPRIVAVLAAKAAAR